MQEIHTEIKINSSLESIWNILTDFGSYHKWNPFLHKITGELSPGNRVNIKMAYEKNKDITFKPEILHIKPLQEICWKGMLLFPGIFDGKHYLTLKPIDKENTLFVNKEIFSGIISSLILSKIKNKTKNGFIAMNRALKELCESNPTNI